MHGPARTRAVQPTGLSATGRTRTKGKRVSPTWIKSSLSFAAGNCVEVADLPDGAVGIRNSRDTDGPVLRITPDEWATFLAGARRWEFDRFGLAGRTTAYLAGPSPRPGPATSYVQATRRGQPVRLRAERRGHDLNLSTDAPAMIHRCKQLDRPAYARLSLNSQHLAGEAGCGPVSPVPQSPGREKPAMYGGSFKFRHCRDGPATGAAWDWPSAPGGRAAG